MDNPPCPPCDMLHDWLHVKHHFPEVPTLSDLTFNPPPEPVSYDIEIAIDDQFSRMYQDGINKHIKKIVSETLWKGLQVNVTSKFIINSASGAVLRIMF
jgi:hypothetical protein